MKFKRQTFVQLPEKLIHNIEAEIFLAFYPNSCVFIEYGRKRQCRTMLYGEFESLGSDLRKESFCYKMAEYGRYVNWDKVKNLVEDFPLMQISWGDYMYSMACDESDAESDSRERESESESESEEVE